MVDGTEDIEIKIPKDKQLEYKKNYIKMLFDIMYNKNIISDEEYAKLGKKVEKITI